MSCGDRLHWTCPHYHYCPQRRSGAARVTLPAAAGAAGTRQHSWPSAAAHQAPRDHPCALQTGAQTSYAGRGIGGSPRSPARRRKYTNEDKLPAQMPQRGPRTSKREKGDRRCVVGDHAAAAAADLIAVMMTTARGAARRSRTAAPSNVTTDRCGGTPLGSDSGSSAARPGSGRTATRQGPSPRAASGHPPSVRAQRRAGVRRLAHAPKTASTRREKQ